MAGVKISIELDGSIVELMDSVAETIPEIRTMRDMGMEVKTEHVARLLFVRGMRALANSATLSAAPQARDQPPAHQLVATPPTATAGAAAIMPSVPLSRRATSILGDPGTETELGTMPVDLGEPEPPPPQWKPWPAKKEIPEEEAEYHAWYAERGWGRFRFKRDDGEHVIYWSPYPKCRVDDDGVLLQPPIAQIATAQGDPYGWAHVLDPAFKYRLMGADGAERREAIMNAVPERRRGSQPMALVRDTDDE